MNRPKIYFAASIRAGRSDQPVYAKIVKLLQGHGKVLSEHFGDPNLTEDGDAMPESDIYSRDKEWVKQADIVVAEVTTPSLGVGIELGWAEEWGKKVYCLYRDTDKKKLSSLVDGSPNFHVLRYKTTNDVKNILKRIFNNSGNKPVST